MPDSAPVFSKGGVDIWLGLTEEVQECISLLLEIWGTLFKNKPAAFHLREGIWYCKTRGMHHVYIEE